MAYREGFNGKGPTVTQRLISTGVLGGDLCGKPAPYTSTPEHWRYSCENAQHGHDGLCLGTRPDGSLVSWWC